MSTTKVHLKDTMFWMRLAAPTGGRHFGRCPHYLVSMVHGSVMLEIKAALHGYWETHPSLFPSFDQTLAGNDEGAGTDFTTGGEVKTQRGHGGNDKSEGRDGVLQSIDHANGTKVEHKHTSRFSYCHKVFQVLFFFKKKSCIHSEKFSSSVCP